jgi:HPt (histidine-containing phosphotransfer) domain-containing protein
MAYRNIRRPGSFVELCHFYAGSRMRHTDVPLTLSDGRVCKERDMSSRSFLPAIVLGLIPRAASRLATQVARAFTRAGRRHISAYDSDVPVLDMSVFSELHATLGSNTERMRNVYTKFLDSARDRIDELRRQPIACSSKTLHALKGSAGMVGASRLAALATRLQEATLDRETLAVALEDLKRELSQFHSVLSAQLDAVSRVR